jgi:hypothetical protein
LSPCLCIEGNHGIDRLDVNSWIGNHRGRVGCFNDCRNIYDCDADGSSIHGYAQQEDEPLSLPLAASCPWQSSQECQPLLDA